MTQFMIAPRFCTLIVQQGCILRLISSFALAQPQAVLPIVLTPPVAAVGNSRWTGRGNGIIALVVADNEHAVTYVIVVCGHVLHTRNIYAVLHDMSLDHHRFGSAVCSLALHLPAHHASTRT